MNKDEYTIETIEDFVGDNHRTCIDIGNPEFNNIVMHFLDKLDPYNKLEVDQHWRSKYNEYIDYNYEPFCTSEFNLRKFIFCHDFSFLKYVSFELSHLLDNLIELEKNLEAQAYTDLKHTEVG